MRVRGVGGRDLRVRLGARALGHDIDRAADAVVGHHAVEQRRRSLDEFDALGQFGVDAHRRQHAVQATVGDVLRGRGEAAHRYLLGIAVGAVELHRGIGQADHVGQALRPPVLHVAAGIGLGGERGIEEIRIAEKTELGTPGDLGPGIRLRQVGRARVAADHGDGRQGGRPLIFSRRGGHRPRGLAQRIAAIGIAHRLQPGALQQGSKAGLGRVRAIQAGAPAPLQQRGIRRQFHPRLHGKGIERLAQRAGRHVDAARLLGPGAGRLGLHPGRPQGGGAGGHAHPQGNVRGARHAAQRETGCLRGNSQAVLVHGLVLVRSVAMETASLAFRTGAPEPQAEPHPNCNKTKPNLTLA